jgi:hypothetical protein
MEEDIKIMKNKQLYEKHVEEQEKKEEKDEEPQDSPAYRVYNDVEIENFTERDEENVIPDIVDEELTEENLNDKDIEPEKEGDLSILTNVAVEPEIEETKKISYTQGKNE